MEINVRNGTGVYDVENVLNDESADTVTATTFTAGTTGASKVAKVVNIGAKVRYDGLLAILVKANSVIPGAKQTVKLQGSNDNFSADIVDLVTKEFGDAAALPGDADIGTGRIDIPYSNVIGSTAYQYLRCGALVNEPSPNTPANHIDYISFLLPNR